jgi:flavin reductase (DIM6/NTAB) family NADH-FMN oxidoreductase RutF
MKSERQLKHFNFEEKASMKKNLGSVLALYPAPVTVVGTMVNGKPNWLLAAHVGILGHDRMP